MIYGSILETIGRTPVVRINKLAPKGVEMYVKVEAFNPLSSVKDRLAIGIIEDAERRGALKPGQTVVDVGANIGCFTVLAARLVGPEGRVVAFEPDPNNLTRLQRNIALNRLKNVTVLPNAIGDRTASVDLFGGGSSLFPSLFDKVDDRQDPTLRGTVSMIALADALEMCQVTRVDYLKLDCEGAEHLIFSTLPPETARCIDQITMEIHKIPGYENDDLMSQLIKLGYSLDKGDLFYFRH